MKKHAGAPRRGGDVKPEGRDGRLAWWSRIVIPSRQKSAGTRPVAAYAVVDPGSTRLRVLAVGQGAEGPTVFGWGEKAMRAGAECRDEELALAFEEALSEAETMARRRSEGWRAADQVVVGLPAWQLRGWASPVVHKRSTPSREVDERELEALLARAFHLSANKVKAPQDREWVLVDAVPAALGVDEQGVTDPVGFRGSVLKASVFAAAARRQTVEAWAQIAEGCGFSDLTVTAAPLALAACPPGAQGIIADVGAAHTNVVWWRAGRPLATGSVDVGGRLLTECLVRQWRLSAEKAETLQVSLSEGQLAADVREQVIEILRPALAIWRHAVEGLLADMHDLSGEPLPHRLLVCGGGSSLPELLDEARALFFSHRLTFGRYPELARLRHTEVPGIANRTEFGRGAGDVPALALAAWSARLAEPVDRPGRVLQKLWR